MQKSAENELPFKCYLFFLHLTVAWQLCGAGLALLYHASGITVLGKELASMGLERCSCSEVEPMKARLCVRTCLSHQLRAVLWHCHCLLCLQFWKDAVVQYLQVTMILHLSKTAGHKCLVVCDGIDSVNRVSLISVHTSAESSLSVSVLRETPLIYFSSRLLCTCPLLGSSALLPQLAHECHYSGEAFDT